MVGFKVYKDEVTANSEQFKHLIFESIKNYIEQYWYEIVKIEETDTEISVSVEI